MRSRRRIIVSCRLVYLGPGVAGNMVNGGPHFWSASIMAHRIVPLTWNAGIEVGTIRVNA